MTKITNCPWYVRGSNLHRALNLFTIKEQIGKRTSRYSNRNLLARELVLFQLLRHLKPLGLSIIVSQR